MRPADAHPPRTDVRGAAQPDTGRGGGRGQAAGQPADHPVDRAAVGRREDHHQRSLLGGDQRVGVGLGAQDRPLQHRGQRGRVGERLFRLHDDDGMRTGQAQAERPGPLDQPGQRLRPAEQQVVDEFAAGAGLRRDQIPARQLIALGQDGDDVVGGAQHHLAGPTTAVGSGGSRNLGQRPPEPPHGRQIQIEQRPQRNATGGGLAPGVPVHSEVAPTQPVAACHRGDQGRQEVGQQVRVDATSFLCGRRGDLVQRRVRAGCRHLALRVCRVCPTPMYTGNGRVGSRK